MSDHHHNPEQQLEQLLQQASTDSGYLTLFYRTLLTAEVYVPGTSEHDAEDAHSVELQHWEMSDGLSVVPFFSSLTQLQNASGQESVPFLTFPLRDLLTITRGERLYLNPKCEYGKLFYPQEIEQLLTNEGFLEAEKPAELVNDQLAIAAITQQPEAMVNALTQLFLQRKLVRKAFLVSAQDNSESTSPTGLLVVLELEHSDDNQQLALIRETGATASHYLTEDEETVDVMVLDPQQQPQFCHYITAHIEPFYQRRLGSWLRDSIVRVK